MIKKSLALLALVPMSSVYAFDEYEYTFIPELATVLAQNEAGQIIGWKENQYYLYDPALPENERLIPLPPEIVYAVDIDDSGKVLGANGTNHWRIPPDVVVWDSVSDTITLPGITGWPAAMNNSGQIIGEMGDKRGTFLYSPETGYQPIDIRYANDINEQGVIAGGHYFRPGPVYTYNTALDIMMYCDRCADGRGINDNNYVVSGFSVTEPWLPLLWSGTDDQVGWEYRPYDPNEPIVPYAGYPWQFYNDPYFRLPSVTTIDGISWGNDLNNLNQVVGYGLWDPQEGYASFPDLLPNVSNATFMEGSFINDAGQITGAQTNVFTPNGTQSPPEEARGVFIISPIESNLPPIAELTATPLPLIVGETLELDGSGSHDQDGYITSYTWEFGDGTALTGSSIENHTYNSTGSYAAILTIEDDDGATELTFVEVNVISQEAFIEGLIDSIPNLELDNREKAVRNNLSALQKIIANANGRAVVNKIDAIINGQLCNAGSCSEGGLVLQDALERVRALY